MRDIGGLGPEKLSRLAVLWEQPLHRRLESIALALILALVPTLDHVVVLSLWRGADGQTVLKDVEERREGGGRSGGAVSGGGWFACVGFAAFGTAGYSLRGW